MSDDEYEGKKNFFFLYKSKLKYKIHEKIIARIIA